MRCVKCTRNLLYKERSQKRCPHCEQVLVFEPKTGDQITDRAFAEALDKLSDSGHLAWQPAQLHHALAKRHERKYLRGQTGTGLLIMAFILGIVFFIFKPWLLQPLWLQSYLAGSALILSVIVFALRSRPVMALEASQVKLWLQRWQKVHGPPAGLIEQARLPRPRQEQTDPSLLDYTVERAVICDKPETVDFLLANNLHIEQRCAILTLGGYPTERFEEIRQMLRRNPQLAVFVLHDASYNGCRLHQELIQNKDWFPGSRRVWDIGIFPRHAQHFKGLWTPAQSPPSTALLGYKPAELAWLQKYRLSLMALPPPLLLKQLRKVFNHYSQQLSSAYAAGAGTEYTIEIDDLLSVGEGSFDADSDFG